MSVEYKAGIAYGIYLDTDTLYKGLENMFENIHSKTDVRDDWFETEEEFQKWYNNGDYPELKELLYDDEVLINLDYYCDSVGYILGYELDSIEWGAKPFSSPDLSWSVTRKLRDRILFWYEKLFPYKEFEEPQMLLYSQLS